MKTTKEAYKEDKRTHSEEEMKKFYTVRGKSVFLTSYALSCGYKDIHFMSGLGYHYIIKNNGTYEAGSLTEYSKKRYFRTLSEARKGL